MVPFRTSSPLLLLAASIFSPLFAQSPPVAAQPGSILDRITSMAEPGRGAWTADQIDTMNLLRSAAIEDSYAYNELAYLTDNIGPRLTGSAQAEAAVQRAA